MTVCLSGSARRPRAGYCATSTSIPASMNARTTSGSNCVPEHLSSSATASSLVMALRYARWLVMASKQSATDRMRDVCGMSVADSFCGYPPPPYHSWCFPIGSARSLKWGMRDIIAAPRPGCSLIESISGSVSLPGLVRMPTGTASFPKSCRSAAYSSRSRRSVETDGASNSHCV